MRVFGLSGSLRSGSYNGRLLAAAASSLPAGVELQAWPHLERVSPYNEDFDTGRPPAVVAALRAELAGSDAILIATPEYNHSVPGQLKNALDWASRPFPDNSLRGKPAAVIGASTGLFGAVWAQAEVRKVLEATGAQVLDRELAVGTAHEAFAPDGSLADPALRAALEEVVADFIGLAASARSRAAA